MIQFTLPYPPSVNSYWRHPTTGKLAGRHLISVEGRAYRSLVAKVIAWQYRLGKLEGDLAITVVSHPPDRRRRDLDNITKATFDSLQHSGLVQDDNQFCEIHLIRGEVKKGGEIRITIERKSNA